MGRGEERGGVGAAFCFFSRSMLTVSGTPGYSVCAVQSYKYVYILGIGTCIVYAVFASKHWDHFVIIGAAFCDERFLSALFSIAGANL